MVRCLVLVDAPLRMWVWFSNHRVTASSISGCVLTFLVDEGYGRSIVRGLVSEDELDELLASDSALRFFFFFLDVPFVLFVLVLCGAGKFPGNPELF